MFFDKLLECHQNYPRSCHLGVLSVMLINVDSEAILTNFGSMFETKLRRFDFSARSSGAQDYKRFSSMSRRSTHNLCSEMT